MEIEVRKEGWKHIAEFTATQDFNLHIEKQSQGRTFVYQRTTDSGEYASLDYYGNYLGNQIVDADFSALIYPKHIRVVCEQPMTVRVTYNND